MLLCLFSPRLLPSPIFLYCRCRCHGPCSHQVQALLLPPPSFHPRPHNHYRILAEVQNRLHHDVLSDYILPLQHILRHIFEPHFLNRRLQRRVVQSPIKYPPGMPPHDPSRDPVLDPPPRDRPMRGVSEFTISELPCIYQ